MGLPAVLLVLLCGLNLIAGVAMTSVAIWLLIEGVFVSHVIGAQLFLTGCVFLLIGGVVVLATAVIGLMALFKHHHVLSYVFLILLVCLFLLYFIGAIMAVIFQDEVDSKVQGSMEKTLQRYGRSGEETLTESWDRLQREFKCCAVTDEGWKVYKETTFFTNQKDSANVVVVKKYVPESCCVYLEKSGEYTNVDRCQSFALGPPGNLDSQFKNVYIFYTGCYEASKDFMKGHAWVLLGLGFGLAVVMIAEIVLAGLFIRRLKNEKTVK